MYSLKKPCANCPFRNDLESNKGWLGKASAEGIINRLIYHREGFPCHKTVDYDSIEDSEDGMQTRNTDKEIQCAGAISLLKYINEPTQAMQIAERLGFSKRLGLDTVEISDNVVKSPEEFINMHADRQYIKGNVINP